MSRYFYRADKLKCKANVTRMENSRLKHLIPLGKMIVIDGFTEPFKRNQFSIQNGISFNQGQQLCYRYDG
jgi:hypothetical protein